MGLMIFNYLNRQKMEFKPLHEGFVGMYVCGPTVYGHSHIGHAKCYITFDVIQRYLTAKGFKVRYVQNITDVGHLTGDADEGEDKIQKKARLDQIEPMEIVENFMRSYFEDMDKINVRRPSISPRATGHVPEQIELAQLLIEKGLAYVRNGSVFFSVQKWQEYGKLSGRKVEELEESGRLEPNPDKDYPADFAVWRVAKPGQIMRWNSPWGEGIPGWHAECSVMSMKYLGLPFDIHGGGLENIFPHNESEIAQAEAAYGKGFANYWILNNMVTVNGMKMGKSLGNSISLKDAYKKYHPMALRFFILESHYRSNTDFSEEAIQSASKGYQRLMGYLQRIQFMIKNLSEAQKSEQSVLPVFQNLIKEYTEKFNLAMDDDFNTPQAIAAVFDFSRVLENLLQMESTPGLQTLQAIEHFYQSTCQDILGIIPENPIEETDIAVTENLMQLVLEIRQNARKTKNWELADKIRQHLQQSGIILEDHAGGTHWKIIKN
ncbi:cysteine--tRNA ligase [candidate division KSB1 bacterium]|nr:cysteine--tRNA ligase [candidate division KSB1 bacterium]